MCCFLHFVQKTAQPWSAFQRPHAGTATAGTTLRRPVGWALLLAGLCGVVLIPARAAEPILTLAMATPDSFRRPALIRKQLPVDAPAAIQAARPAAPAATPALFETSLPRATEYLTRETPPPRANPILMTGRYLTELGHAKFWSRLTAGYGEVFYGHSAAVYGHNGWEQPACGYLKLSFSF